MGRWGRGTPKFGPAARAVSVDETADEMAVAASRIGLHGQSSLVLLYTREGKLRQRIMPVRGFGGVAPTDASDAARLLMRKHADVLSERHVSFTQARPPPCGGGASGGGAVLLTSYASCRCACSSRSSWLSRTITSRTL